MNIFTINILTKIVINAIPILLAIVLHEVSHGWMAYRLGDDTAKRMGRLTLNPISHIDPVGTIVLPLLMIIMGGPVFGWAKPVPFNPYNFNRNVNIRNGIMWVAIAGPGINMIIAFISSFLYVGAIKYLPGNHPVVLFSSALIVINLWLACLNLIPIPPLDGSKILMRFLPPKYESQFLQLERYGFLILIILLATGSFSKIIWGPVEFLIGLFLRIPQIIFGII